MDRRPEASEPRDPWPEGVGALWTPRLKGDGFRPSRPGITWASSLRFAPRPIDLDSTEPKSPRDPLWLKTELSASLDPSWPSASPQSEQGSAEGARPTLLVGRDVPLKKPLRDRGFYPRTHRPRPALDPQGLCPGPAGVPDTQTPLLSWGFGAPLQPTHRRGVSPPRTPLSRLSSHERPSLLRASLFGLDGASPGAPPGTVSPGEG